MPTESTAGNVTAGFGVGAAGWVLPGIRFFVLRARGERCDGWFFVLAEKMRHILVLSVIELSSKYMKE